MQVLQAYRFELDPNNAQKTALAKHAGAARFASNWGLAERKRMLDEGLGTTNAIAQHKAWNNFKRDNAPWWTQVSKCAPQEALRDLDRGMKAFFKSKKAKGAKRVGFPKFKCKGRNDSFRLTGSIKVDERSVTLPRLGTIRTKESTAKLLSCGARILSATCRKQADRWYVSLTVEVERPEPVAVKGPVVGIDRGIHTFAVSSDAEVIESPKALSKGLRKIANRRQDALHKATTNLAKTKWVIVVEDLNVSGMIRNRHLSRAIADMGWGEFARQLTYKCRWYGSKLVVAEQFFPSTKTCSGCGVVADEIPLSQRMFVCGHCGLSIDRDLNAATNLRNLYVAASSAETQNACGGESPGQNGKVLVKLAPAKQEPHGRARERLA